MNWFKNHIVGMAILFVVTIGVIHMNHYCYCMLVHLEFCSNHLMKIKWDVDAIKSRMEK